MKSLSDTWEAQLAGKLPFNFTYRASRVLSQVRTSRDARMLRRVRAGLRVVSDDHSIDPKPFLSQSLARVVAAEKIPQLESEQLLKQITVIGREYIESLQTDKQGFLLVGIQPLLLPILKQLTETERPLADLVFQPGENPNAHTRDLWHGKGFGFLHEHYPAEGNMLWCPLLGKLVSTSTRVAEFALEHQVSILPVWLKSENLAQWHIIIKPPVAPHGSPETLTMELNQQFESSIKEFTGDIDWLNHPWRAPVRQILWSRRQGNVALPEAISPTELLSFRMLVGVPRTIREACLAIPGIRALKRGRPDARITLLTTPDLQDLWKALEEVDDLLFIDSDASGSNTDKSTKTFDLGILLSEDLETFDYMSHLPIDRVVAMEGTDFEHLIDDVLPLNRRFGPPEHGSRRFLRVAHRLGAEVIEDEKLFATLATSVSPPPSEYKHIALAIGSDDGDSYCWDVGRYADLVKRLSGFTPCLWHLLGTPKDNKRVKELMELCKEVKFTNHLEEKPLTEQVYVLRSTSFIIANDNAFLHLAAACGIPGIGIFGPTEPATYRPLGDHIRVVRHHVECSPCNLGDCPLDHRCMKAVEVEEVVQLLTHYC
ncbi:MAG: glycosyltransferase family 9 protein [Verrucomicrobiota bacterium]